MKSILEGYEGKAETIKGSLSEVIASIHQKGYKHLYIDGGIPLFGELPKPMGFEHVKTEVFLSAIVQNHYNSKQN